MSAEHVQLLKQFIDICKQNPSVLHQPQFSFYKQYLESLGAKIPADTKSSTSSYSTSPKSKSEEQQEEPQATDEKSEAEPEEPEVPAPELDENGVVEDKTGDMHLPMGEPDKEVSEQDMEKSSEHRDAAMSAFNEGDYQKALELFTAAIELNPGSAILHAKRANTLLKMSKLKAAIQDCNKAISINPDAAQPYKFRGRAHRLLGNWLDAHHDLALSCQLDYDDTAYEWLKEVEPKAKKLQDYERAKKRQAEEKELRERRERVRRAQEQNRRAAEEAAKARAEFGGDEDEEMGGFGGAGMGGGGGGINDLLQGLFSDPELMEAMKKDPSLAQKLMEITQNPSNLMKYLHDPGVQKLLGKLGSKFGGRMPGASSETAADHGSDSAGGGTESTGDGNAGNGGEPKTANVPPPKKAPEPDLD